MIDDPTAIFDAQDDASGSGFLLADTGLNANLVATAGSATTFMSKHQVATSTKATTAALDLHLIRLAPVGLNAYGINARILCSINAHSLGGTVVAGI